MAFQLHLLLFRRFLLALFLVLLSACAAPAEPTPAPPTTTAAIAPQPAFEPITTPTPQPPPEAATLILWTTEQGAALDLLHDLVAQFGEQNNVTITVVPISASHLRVDLIAAELANDPLPGLIWASQNTLAELYADGQLQPIGAASGAGDFIQALVSGATAEGKLWGAPLTAQAALLLLYNRDLVSEPPATTDELIVQSRTVANPEQYGLAAGWLEARWLLTWLNGFGGAPTNASGARPTLDTPEMVSALNLLRELAVAAPPDQRSYAAGREWFASGAVAFAIDGDWALEGENPITATINLGIAPLPQVPATGRRAAPALEGAYLMFSRFLADENREHAHALVNFLTQPDIQVQIGRTLHRLPALRVTLAAPTITADPMLAAAAAQADAAIGLPPTPALRCALQAIEGELPTVLDGETPPEEAAQAMQQAAETCATR